MKLSVIAAWLYATMRFSGSARRALGGELGAVDEIAEVARELDAVARLDGLAARLGVLPGEAADADHRALALVDHHEGHLEQDLHLVRDDRRTAVGERLRAVAALQEEALALLGFGELALQALDLPGRDERRELAQAAQAVSSAAGVVRDGLGVGLRFPGIRGPGGHGKLRHGAGFSMGAARLDGRARFWVGTTAQMVSPVAALRHPVLDRPGPPGYRWASE